ncbi:centromeric protein E [Entomortierella parvispora]|uniref:Kinesin-like protein n=1 Tax=Entomortierella parvispora TaxID=205924 RepID=A0A9P3LW20_9FUNG|nr:centromeric protein E [Entomortierella parvispora]
MLKSVADRLGIPHSSSSSSLSRSPSSSRATSPNPSGRTSVFSSSSSSSSVASPSSRSPSRQQQIPKPSSATPSSLAPPGQQSASGIRKISVSSPMPVLPPLAAHDHSSLATSVANAAQYQDHATTPSPSAAPSTSKTEKTENVTVTVRIRPFSNSELRVAGGPTDVWAVSDDGSRIGYADDYAVQARRAMVDYGYDHALTGSDNELIYGTSVKNLVQSAMEGYNGTVFAYGQTSSGKTYTMSGTEDQPGITPRAVEDVFKYIRQNSDREFLLRVSYLEIYNESIRDLLSPEAIDLRIHEDRRRGVYVSPLKEEIVTTPSQVMRIIERGDYQRHVSSTDFNAHSSRSHSIFQIVIESRDRSPGATTGSPTVRKPLGAKSASAVRVSQLNLIDLAGSEKASTDVERRKEGAFINKSLLTLGTVISKLTEEKGAHIPYRDSKLTRILQSSLNGSARVSVICTISPSHLNVEESHNTLKFAARVKKVVTKAQTNQVMDDKALLEKYRREISELKAQLMMTAAGEAAGANASGAKAAVGGKQQAELSSLLQKERLKHEEEMVEMNMVRNALKERIDHLTKLILTSQSVNSRATVPEQAATRYTVETSSDGTVLEFPKEIESRLARKDTMVRQLQTELEVEQEKVALMRAALEKAAKGEVVDLERTLAKLEMNPVAPRDKFLMEKRASIMNLTELEHLDAGGENGDLAALLALQKKQEGTTSQTQSIGTAMDDDSRSLLVLAPGDSDDEGEGTNALSIAKSAALESELLEMRSELQSLRQAKRELEIVVVDQEKKLEDMVAFEDSDEFRNLVLELEEQRERIVVLEEEKEMAFNTITELRNQVRKLEYARSSGTPPPSSGGMAGVPTMPSTPNSSAAEGSRIRELELMAQKEKRLRMSEQSRNMGRIASLEAELTMVKAELSVRNLAGYS